jgi:hypothetical protein
MANINLPKQAKKFVWSALRAGVLKDHRLPKVGSPLLCNIALHGIEDLWNERKK